MTANRPIEAVKKFVRDLQLEHYDLLHKHGYADYRLDEEPVEGYTEDALHLTELYERDLTLLLRQEYITAKKEALESLEIPKREPYQDYNFIKVGDAYHAGERTMSLKWQIEVKKRIAELTNTQEGKDK